MTKRKLLGFLLGIQILIVSNLAYSIYTMQRYITNGRYMVTITDRYERRLDGRPEILILGDSLAYGVGTSTGETSFAGQIAQAYPDKSIVNKSVVGDSTTELASDIDEHLDNKRYESIYILISGNDIFRFGVDIQDSADNLRDITSKAAEHADTTYLITTPDFKNVSLIPWFSRGFYSNRSNIIHQAAISIHNNHDNVVYVDTYDVDPSHYSKLEATDGFHLNDDGIKELVELITSYESS